MKIKSRFRDYYDYVAHDYGGGDERNIYVREPFKNELTVAYSKSDFLRYNHHIKDHEVTVKYLIINGRFYVMVSTTDDNGLRNKYKLLTEENFGDCSDKVFRTYNGKFYGKSIDWSQYFGVESDAATEISQQVAQPVFTVSDISWNRYTRKYSFSVDQNIPVLQECGINHYIQPQQLYQEIAYYISNKMVVSSDLVVIDNMTDKEKIAQHGFDTKQSFRHRTQS